MCRRSRIAEQPQGAARFPALATAEEQEESLPDLWTEQGTEEVKGRPDTHSTRN